MSRVDQPLVHFIADTHDIITSTQVGYDFKLGSTEHLWVESGSRRHSNNMTYYSFHQEISPPALIVFVKIHPQTVPRFHTKGTYCIAVWQILSYCAIVHLASGVVRGADNNHLCLLVEGSLELCRVKSKVTTRVGGFPLLELKQTIIS